MVDVADEALRSRQGLDVVGVQAVERAEIGEVEPPALGRVWVRVGQMREVRREGWLAMHGDRADRFTDFGAGSRRGHKKRGAERKANR